MYFIVSRYAQIDVALFFCNKWTVPPHLNPLYVRFFCSCDKVDHKQEIRPFVFTSSCLLSTVNGAISWHSLKVSAMKFVFFNMIVIERKVKERW